jgi:Leucine-rich repeat (LRR) protein
MKTRLHPNYHWLTLIPLAFIFASCNEKNENHASKVHADSGANAGPIPTEKSTDTVKLPLDPQKLPWEKGIDDAIQKVANKKTRELTLSDLESVKTLSISAKGIQSLAGLELLSNLEELSAKKNEITDLGPLRTLRHLKMLKLGDNSIADLAPLKGLAELTTLELDHNSIVDVSPLGGLQKLQELSMTDNFIESFEPLKNCPALSHLGLAQNQLVSLETLPDFKGIVSFDATYNKIDLANELEFRK